MTVRPNVRGSKLSAAILLPDPAHPASYLVSISCPPQAASQLPRLNIGPRQVPASSLAVPRPLPAALPVDRTAGQAGVPWPWHCRTRHTDYRTVDLLLSDFIN